MPTPESKFTAAAYDHVTATIVYADFNSYVAAQKWTTETPNLEKLSITTAWRPRKYPKGKEADDLRAAGFLAEIPTADNTPITAKGMEGPQHTPWQRRFESRKEMDAWLAAHIDTATFISARYPRGAEPKLDAARKRRDADLAAKQPKRLTSTQVYAGTKQRALRFTDAEWRDVLLIGNTALRELVTAEASRLRADATPGHAKPPCNAEPPKSVTTSNDAACRALHAAKKETP